MKKKKKLTAFGFVKIIKKSLGESLLLYGGYEGILNFLAMSMRLRINSEEMRDATYVKHKYEDAANKIHKALEKRGYYDD